MADDITLAQAEAAKTAATTAATTAASELQAAIKVQAQKGGAQSFIKVQEARLAFQEASESLAQASAIAMEMNQQLKEAIKAISDAADEDGLLKNPFDDETQLGAFVDPLTPAEILSIRRDQTTIEKYQGLIDGLSTSSFVTGITGTEVFTSQISFYEREIERIQTTRINPLLEKRAKASAEFEAKIRAVRKKK